MLLGKGVGGVLFVSVDAFLFQMNPSLLGADLNHVLESVIPFPVANSYHPGENIGRNPVAAYSGSQLCHISKSPLKHS